MFKAVSLCLVAVLAFVSGSQAETSAAFGEPSSASKGFSVTFSVLTALHYANWARVYALELGEDTHLGAMMKNLLVQNTKFQQGLAAVQEYVNDADESVSIIGKGMSAAMLIHMEENDKAIEMLKAVSNLDPAGLKNVEYRLAERAANQKQAWEMMGTSATFVGYVLVQPAESLSPK